MLLIAWNMSDGTVEIHKAKCTHRKPQKMGGRPNTKGAFAQDQVDFGDQEWESRYAYAYDYWNNGILSEYEDEHGPGSFDVWQGMDFQTCTKELPEYVDGDGHEDRAQPDDQSEPDLQSEPVPTSTPATESDTGVFYVLVKFQKITNPEVFGVTHVYHAMRLATMDGVEWVSPIISNGKALEEKVPENYLPGIQGGNHANGAMSSYINGYSRVPEEATE